MARKPTVTCFNCNGAGTCIMYPNVESVIASGAPQWLLHPDLAWIERSCPYCTEPHPFEMIFFV